MRPRSGLEPGFRVVEVEAGGRLSLPLEYIGKLKWLDQPEKVVSAWLLTLGSGRNRLLATAHVEASDQLRALAEDLRGTSQADEGQEPFHADAPEVAALVTILVPITMSRKGRGWRLELPRELRQLMQAQPGTNVVMLFCQGYLEIWSPALLAEAQRTSWSRIEFWEP